MKIALYKNTKYGFENVGDELLDGVNNYIRISEFIDIEFDMLDRAESVKKEIDIIDSQINEINLSAGIEIEELKQRKAELLALPDLKEE